jgi:tetratricopeptide (TPR) repeat protein/DNA-binding XRE family transcriptional regulator
VASGRRGRRLGVEIKPGTVKQARREAGLSLGQVAGDLVSRTAIYFVETGKSKPSMETLKMIAERTGRPLDFFLSRPSTMEARSGTGTAEVERLLATNDLEGALVAGQAVLDRERDPEIIARTKHLMATAHLRLAQPVQGRRLAAAARAHFEQTGDLLMTAECLGSEASAAYLLQDPGALALAEGALATCRTLKPIPRITEARLLAILGGVHVSNRDWAAAIACFEQATAAGEVVHDLRRLSLLYSDLSLAHQETGQLNQAAQYAQRAMTIHETLNDRLSLARSENNLGLLYFKRGQLAQALGHVDRSLALFEEAGVEVGRANVLLSLCELHLAAPNFETARRYADEALAVAARASEPANVAEAHVWLGRVAAAQHDDRKADAEFANAIKSLEQLGFRERLLRSHVGYAEILESRGDLAGANHHLRRAIAASQGALSTPQSQESRTASA